MPKRKTVAAQKKQFNLQALIVTGIKNNGRHKATAYKSPGKVSEKGKHLSISNCTSQSVISYQSDNNFCICHYLIGKRLKEAMQLHFRVKTEVELLLCASYKMK